LTTLCLFSNYVLILPSTSTHLAATQPAKLLGGVETTFKIYAAMASSLHDDGNESDATAVQDLHFSHPLRRTHLPQLRGANRREVSLTAPKHRCMSKYGM
jgi:hypothetical protein